MRGDQFLSSALEWRPVTARPRPLPNPACAGVGVPDAVFLSLAGAVFCVGKQAGLPGLPFLNVVGRRSPSLSSGPPATPEWLGMSDFSSLPEYAAPGARAHSGVSLVLTPLSCGTRVSGIAAYGAQGTLDDPGLLAAIIAAYTRSGDSPCKPHAQSPHSRLLGT